ncbi:MAG TPA: hypothetical protein VFS37_12335, partial [Conexibacter sp.]|nr:hypothetical protein [Conexibacter sp.]
MQRAFERELARDATERTVEPDFAELRSECLAAGGEAPGGGAPDKRAKEEGDSDRGKEQLASLHHSSQCIAL